MMENRVKLFLSIIAFISAIIIGFIAMFLPPSGEIHNSVLWFTAQLLIFVSGLLGMNMSIDNLKQKIAIKPKRRTRKKKTTE